MGRSQALVDATIVEADAPGIERGLAGTDLLEAAEVGGCEDDCRDALANALAPSSGDGAEGGAPPSR